MANYEDDKLVESEKLDEGLSPRLEPIKIKRNDSELEIGTPKVGLNSRFLNSPYIDYDHSIRLKYI